MIPFATIVAYNHITFFFVIWHLPCMKQLFFNLYFINISFHCDRSMSWYNFNSAFQWSICMTAHFATKFRGIIHLFYLSSIISSLLCQIVTTFFSEIWAAYSTLVPSFVVSCHDPVFIACFIWWQCNSGYVCFVLHHGPCHECDSFSGFFVVFLGFFNSASPLVIQKQACRCRVRLAVFLLLLLLRFFVLFFFSYPASSLQIGANIWCISLFPFRTVYCFFRFLSLKPTQSDSLYHICRI